VQVGTATFADPLAPLRVIEGLAAYVKEQGLSSIPRRDRRGASRSRGLAERQCRLHLSRDRECLLVDGLERGDHGRVDASGVGERSDEAVARRVETFDAFVAANEVQFEAFESTGDELAEARALLPEIWADRTSLIETGFSVTGDAMVAMGKGPVPQRNL